MERQGEKKVIWVMCCQGSQEKYFRKIVVVTVLSAAEELRCKMN